LVKTIVEKITRNVYLLRLDDDQTRYFEAIWEIPEGVTYNSYLITTSEGAAVIDGWKKGYGELHLETIRGIVDPGDVRYIVVNHTEPDHSGSIKTLVGSLKNATILGHNIAISLLNAFYGVAERVKPVNDGEAVGLGEEVLRFYHTPWLHWPDTIFTYYEKERILFTCDAFGSYGIPSKIFYEDLPVAEKELFNRYTRKYFANIIGKHAEWVVKNLDKLSKLGLKIDVIAPSHGPLHREPNRIIELYRELGERRVVKGKVVVVYTSMYGFINEAVEILVDELRKRGVEPVIHRFDDKEHSLISEVITDLYDAETIVFGAATYDADLYPIGKYILEIMKAKTKGVGKRLVVISSYGWGPVAAKKIKDLTSDMGFEIVDTVEFKGRTSEARIRELASKITS